MSNLRSARWSSPRRLLPALASSLLALPALAQVPGSTKREVRIASATGNLPALDDGDSFGRSVASLGDLDGDGVADLAVGATGDDDGAPNAGAVWILFLAADGSVLRQTKIGAASGGFTGTLAAADRFGTSVAAVGDVDGDGVVDLAVGATGVDDGGSRRGAVFLLFLAPDGSVLSHRRISATSGGFAGSLDDGDELGSALAGLGDLDGNGTPDLAVGAWLDDDGGADSGAVWVLFLAPDGGVVGQAKVSRTAGGLGGALASGDVFGVSLAAEPGLPAGTARLAVGAMNHDAGGPDRGAVWVLGLDSSGAVTSEDAITGTRIPLADGDRFGGSVAFLGDVDDAGFSDLAIGAPWSDAGGPERGAVHVVYLRPRTGIGGIVAGNVELSSGSGFFQGTLADGDRFGCAVAALGDLDGDGFEDCVAGAYLDDTGGTDRGALWVSLLTGCPDAQVSQRNGSGANAMRLTSRSAPGFSGTWHVDVDCSGHAPSFVALVGVAAPHQGLFVAGGEVLVDLSSELFFLSKAVHAGGTATFSYAIPTDLTFCSFTAHAQAVVGGAPGYELTNALDFTTGR